MKNLDNMMIAMEVRQRKSIKFIAEFRFPIMNHAQIKAYYESRYQQAQGEAFPRDAARAATFIQPISNRLAPGEKVLDIGCGVGYACELLAQQQLAVYGIDISAEALKLAQIRVPQGRFAQIANDGALPYPNGFFDALTCLGVLEHVLHPEFLLQECRRVMQPAGMAIFVVPNARSPYFCFAGGTGQLYEHPRALAEWRKLLQANGFAIAETRKDPGPTLLKSFPCKKKAKIFLHRCLNLLPLAYTYQFIFAVLPTDFRSL